MVTPDVATVPANAGHGPVRIHLDGVAKSFSGRVVVDIDELVLGERPVEGLLGPNGAGKTTLMRLIMHSLPLDRGRVQLVTSQGSVTLSQLPTHRMAGHGVVKTNQVITDFDQLTILDSLLLAVADRRHEQPRRVFGERALLADHVDQIRHWLDYFGFDDPMRLALSAGEKKLLDIVRCLLLKPSFLLLDEPTAGLPEDVTRKVMTAIGDLAAAGTTVIIVEHDLEVIWELCELVTFMAEGRVLMKDDPHTIRTHRTVVEKYLGSEHV